MEEDNSKEKKKNPLESRYRIYKRIAIGVIALFTAFIIIITVIITPIMAVGVVDIGNSSNNNIIGNDYENFDSSTLWWPIAGEDQEVDSKDNLISTGDPVSMLITSPYGATNGRNHVHRGIDIGPNISGPVYIIASGSGVVIYPDETSSTNCPTTTDQSSPDASCGGGYGNYVKIMHDNSVLTLYGHMAPNSITVKSGDTVRQGQIIGIMGSTGSSTGTHLHFEVQVGGARVDPMNYISTLTPRPV